MSEFQAVVMAAGEGSRMYPLTEAIPKALLPVGNFPMIWYPINSFQKAGFEVVIVVVLESVAAQVSQALTVYCDPKMKFDILTIPDDADWGTADSLRHIKDKIEKDVIVISCDLISDVAMHHLADIHRSYDASVTALLAPVVQTSADREAANIAKAKKKTETETYQHDFVGIDTKENRLLFYASEADLDDNLVVKKSLLKRYPCINIVTDLMDAHLYIIKKWVLDFLAENRSINSIRGELIPYLVKKQFQRHQKPKLSFLHGQDTASISVAGDDTKPDVFSFAKEDEISTFTRELSSWCAENHDSGTGTSIRCNTYVMNGGVCIRTNTVPFYMEANRQIPRLLPQLTTREIPLVHPSASWNPKSQVGNDCMVDESVSVGERVSVKKSVIGKHTTIGDKVKISNSIIMDHVTIKEGCNIQGCIICTSAYIKENCTLKDCQVGNSHTVAEGSDIKGEAVVAEQLMDF